MDYYVMQGLKARQGELEKLIKEKQAAVKKAPKGQLRCARRGKRFEYSWAVPGSGKYRYISKKNIRFAAALAQRWYDERILNLAKQELKLIRRLIKQCDPDGMDAVYNESPLSRKALVHPVRLSDEEFLANWLKQESCLGKFNENDQEYYTEKGERVRSKSEIFIANAMYFKGVPYLFEPQINLIGYGPTLPDFFVLDLKTRRTIVWEHLGKMGDPAYVERNLRKINAYLRSGYIIGETLILTFESDSQPLNTVFIENIIRHYFL